MPRLKLAPQAAHLHAAATAGDAEAQWRLGQAHWLGHLVAEGLPRSPKLARAWLEAAASHGHAQALERLGFADLGLGFGEDPEAPKPCTARALKRMEAAAAAGADGCLLWLGEHLANQGPEARERALQHLRQAAVRAPRAGDRQAARERLASLAPCPWEAGLQAVREAFEA